MIKFLSHNVQPDFVCLFYLSFCLTETLCRGAETWLLAHSLKTGIPGLYYLNLASLPTWWHCKVLCKYRKIKCRDSERWAVSSPRCLWEMLCLCGTFQAPGCSLPGEPGCGRARPCVRGVGSPSLWPQRLGLWRHPLWVRSPRGRALLQRGPPSP